MGVDTVVVQFVKGAVAVGGALNIDVVLCVGDDDDDDVVSSRPSRLLPIFF